MAESKRRALGEDAIYFDHRGACRDALKHRRCPGRWLGMVSLGRDDDGKRIRTKVYGRTKTDVKDKLKELHAELDQGIKTSASYTVEMAVADWLHQGLDGRSAKTISTNREVLAPVLALIGKIPLRQLTAADVRTALTRLAATRSARTVTIARNALARPIRHAEANDFVRRNVAALVTPRKGLEGRPSKSLTLRQAQAPLKAAETSRLHA